MTYTLLEMEDEGKGLPVSSANVQYRSMYTSVTFLILISLVIMAELII